MDAQNQSPNQAQPSGVTPEGRELIEMAEHYVAEYRAENDFDGRDQQEALQEIQYQAAGVLESGDYASVKLLHQTMRSNVSDFAAMDMAEHQQRAAEVAERIKIEMDSWGVDNEPPHHPPTPGHGVTYDHGEIIEETVRKGSETDYAVIEASNGGYEVYGVQSGKTGEVTFYCADEFDKAADHKARILNEWEATDHAADQSAAAGLQADRQGVSTHPDDLPPGAEAESLAEYRMLAQAHQRETQALQSDAPAPVRPVTSQEVAPEAPTRVRTSREEFRQEVFKDDWEQITDKERAERMLAFANSKGALRSDGSPAPAPPTASQQLPQGYSAPLNQPGHHGPEIDR
ncbi:hypothetical protein [Nesterenkonia alkaliphila]|uniref:Uncharacterized protein n=1 Tax=Nesterenkonia alkaliphila TaxID=1463631 RepID=A0A7K1UGZ6_9MICC|nr:hypothetical protein [Nesterenkonia alkaliphila]MVT25733.1 hypothetical protein [Nesterenkonia alkaliphila]GFZ85426.1 hypothetical protein GCM10011359_13200 [Nesterenkonia alkaliphila]